MADKTSREVILARKRETTVVVVSSKYKFDAKTFMVANTYYVLWKWRGRYDQKEDSLSKRANQDIVYNVNW